MDSPLFYAYQIILDTKPSFLLWEMYCEEKDRFYTDAAGRLVREKSYNELIEALDKTIEIEDEGDIFCINLDTLPKALEKIHKNESTPQAINEEILSYWNFVEDIYRTFSLTEQRNKLDTPLLNKAYKKLFYGNNFESIQKDNPVYEPIWSEEEAMALKKELHDSLTFIKQKIFT